MRKASILDVAIRLFPELHVIHCNIIVFRLECVAHRLIKSGWERHVNVYSSRELLILAYMMPPLSRAPLMAEAMARAMVEGNQVVLDLAKEAA